MNLKERNIIILGFLVLVLCFGAFRFGGTGVADITGAVTSSWDGVYSTGDAWCAKDGRACTQAYEVFSNYPDYPRACDYSPPIWNGKADCTNKIYGTGVTWPIEYSSGNQECNEIGKQCVAAYDFSGFARDCSYTREGGKANNFFGAIALCSNDFDVSNGGDCVDDSQCTSGHCADNVCVICVANSQCDDGDDWTTDTCESNVCVNERTCTDLDNRNYNVKGQSCTKGDIFNIPGYCVFDVCIDDTRLKEYYCEDGIRRFESFTCEKDCHNGACFYQVGYGVPECWGSGVDEGWFVLTELAGRRNIRFEECSGCYAICKGNGWYSSCDDTLIETGFCSELGCIETDIGLDLVTQGTTCSDTPYPECRNDHCLGANALLEFSCEGDLITSTYQACDCSNGICTDLVCVTDADCTDGTCVGGQCIDLPPPPQDTDGDGVPDSQDDCPDTPAGNVVGDDGCTISGACSDTDGMDYFVKGRVVADTPGWEYGDWDNCVEQKEVTFFGSTSTIPIQVDSCSSDDDCYVLEDYCDGNEAKTDLYRCLDGCNDGACISAVGDEDGDGVDNGDDLCPDTPAGEPVNADGCSDSQLDDGDDDGVIDDDDLCPGTPAGIPVDADGCPIIVCTSDADCADPDPLCDTDNNICVGCIDDDDCDDDEECVSGSCEEEDFETEGDLPGGGSSSFYGEGSKDACDHMASSQLQECSGYNVVADPNDDDLGELCAGDLCYICQFTSRENCCAYSTSIGCYDIDKVSEYVTCEFGKCKDGTRIKSCTKLDGSLEETTEDCIELKKIKQFPFFDNISLLIAVLMLTMYYIIRRKFLNKVYI